MTTVTISVNVGTVTVCGVCVDDDCQVECGVTFFAGCAATGPTYSCGGTPPESAEIDFNGTIDNLDAVYKSICANLAEDNIPPCSRSVVSAVLCSMLADPDDRLREQMTELAVEADEDQYDGPGDDYYSQDGPLTLDEQCNAARDIGR